MVRLSSVIVSDDNGFRSQLGALLRAAAVPVRVTDDRFPREGLTPDVVVVDGRAGTQSTMQTVERVRIAAPTANIFFVAQDAAPELILHSMRAGANEFLTWPPARETLDDAIRRMAARLEAIPGDRSVTTRLAFFGAKGGVGTTTVAVNCAVEIARLGNRATLLVDLKPGLGEASLFLGLRSRYTLLDALDNLHRLDAEFLRELVVKHKSGLELLAGSPNFDRPAPAELTPAGRLVLAALIDAERATERRALPAVPARKMSDDRAAEPILEAAARASLCRVRNRGECEHCCPNESHLLHRTSPCSSNVVCDAGRSQRKPLPWREAALPLLLL